ncbi:MAG: putative Ig domain-containing protein [Treponema sp.]|nr:putative Ig domain-containing protein [Treponema sp.]
MKKRTKAIGIVLLAMTFVTAMSCGNSSTGDPSSPSDPYDSSLPTLTYTGSTLSDGKVGQSYSVSIGTADLPENAEPVSISYALTSGSLPAGLTLSSGGLLSGTPTSAGTKSFTVRASAEGCNSKSASFTLKIAASDSSGGGGTPNIAFSVGTGLRSEYLYNDSGFFDGSRVYYDLIVYDAAGMDSITINEDISGAPNGFSNSRNQTRVIPITGPGIYHISQEIRNSLIYTDKYTFQYRVNAYGKSYSTNYTGAYYSYNGLWSHYFAFKSPALEYKAFSLPDGIEDKYYAVDIGTAKFLGGGAANISYRILSGSLPAGFSLSASGFLSGTSSFASAGTKRFSVEASANGYNSVLADFTLSILPQPTLPASKISGGLGYSLAIDSGSDLWTWGGNYYGQLGNGTTSDHSFPLLTKGAMKYKEVAAGTEHTLAIDSDGNLWAWGSNYQTQLGGWAFPEGSSTPIKIKDGAKFNTVAAGYDHNLLIDCDGYLWAFGGNGAGQLGDGTTTTRNSLVQIKAGSKFTAVAAGYGYSLAVDSDGNLWAWGYNGDGRLGDGTTTTRNSPVQIKAGTKFIAIAAGYYHSLAIDSVGNLWAWGTNSEGKLGDGTTIDRYSPVQIKTGTKFTSVAAGQRHSLALDSDGNLWTWGYNGDSQLGDGTTSDRYSPVQIKAGTKFSSIAAGTYHSLAIDSSGYLWAWGSNSSGQLGDGTTTNALTPIKIFP